MKNRKIAEKWLNVPTIDSVFIQGDSFRINKEQMLDLLFWARLTSDSIEDKLEDLFKDCK